MKTSDRAYLQSFDQCECCDPGCTGHEGKSECQRKPRLVLRRIDFADTPRCAFCNTCAEDALESGAFGE